MGHGDDVRPRPGGQRPVQALLGRGLDVTGRQHGPVLDVEQDDEGRVVDPRPVRRPLPGRPLPGRPLPGRPVTGRPGGPQHPPPHLPGGAGHPGAAGHRRHPVGAENPLHLADAVGRLGQRTGEDLADGPPVQRAGQAGHVVGVEVAQDDEVERVHAQVLEAAVDGRGVGACVDEHGRRRAAAGDQGAALADVAGHGQPSRRRPGGASQPAQGPGQDDERDGDEDTDEDAGERTCQATDEQRPGQPQHGGGQQQPGDGDDGQQDRPWDPRGPRHRGSRQTGSSTGDTADPPGGDTGDARDQLGGLRGQRGEHRRQDAEHRGRGDRRGDEQVGRDRQQRHVRGEQDDDRSAHGLRRRRDGDGVCRDGGQDPAEGCGHRPGEQQQRTGGQHRQREAEGAGQPRVDDAQGDDGAGQQRHAPPTPGGGQPGEPDGTHDRGPQDAGLWAGQGDEAGERAAGEGQSQPASGSGRRGSEQDRTADDGRVRPGHGGQVRQPGGPHVLLEVGRQGARVPDDETGQQSPGVRRQRRRRAAQPLAQ